MRDEVLRPLGMMHSSFGLDSAESPLAVVPRARVPSALFGELLIVTVA